MGDGRFPKLTLPPEWEERLAPFRLPGILLIGGCLRDHLLGRTPGDYDLLVPGPAGPRARSAARQLGATAVVLDPGRDIHRLAFPDGTTLDLKPYPDLPTAVANADFTINAILYELADNQWRDPAGGLGDLRRRRLRMVNARVFVDDPLRILRAARFAATLGLAVTPPTERELLAARPLLAGVARERVVAEVRLILGAREAGRAARLLDRWGVLTDLLPPLAPARGLEQNLYHHLDVLEHTLAAVDSFADEVWPSLAGGEWRDYDRMARGDWPRRAVLALALLLHDAGKPGTLTTDVDGRRHFYGHELAGAALADKSLRAGKYPVAVARAVRVLVRHHLRAANLVRGEGGARAARRYAAAVGDWFPGGLALAVADRLAARGPESAAAPADLLAHCRRLAHQWFASRDELVPPKLLDGHELMNLVPGLSGPKVGSLLRRLRAAQLNGVVTTKTEALALVLKWTRIGDGGSVTQ